jgi:O-antigen/teichoic acid export membrane protein
MKDLSSPPAHSLTAQAFQGMVWNFLGAGLRVGMVFVSGVVVAWNVDVPDFAVAGKGMAIAGLFNAFYAQGFAMALVREKDLKPSQCHCVFFLLLAIGLVLGCSMAALSPLFAWFYDQPALMQVMPVLSLILVLSLVGSVPNALLTRAMNFRDNTALVVGGTFVSAGLAVVLALSKAGFWALILPPLAATIVYCLGSFWVSGYRPAASFRWSESRGLGKFGSKVLGNTFLNYLCENSDYLIMGHFWLEGYYGLYYFAYEKARQPFDIVWTQIGNALYPAFSRVQGEIDRIRRGYFRGTRLLALLTLPLYVLLIGLADPVIPWIFGRKWMPAVGVFQIFAVMSALRTFTVMIPSPLMAMNRITVPLYLTIFRTAITLPALVMLGIYGAGIEATAAALLLIWSVHTPLFVGYFFKLTNVTAKDFRDEFGRVLSAAAAMGAALLGARIVAHALEWPDWMMAPFAIVASSSVFLFATRSLIRDLFELARNSIVKK